MAPPTLLHRLKERKLVQWALAYLAGAWALVECVGFLGDQFAWPGKVVQVITILAAFGFFVALVMAWYHGEKGQQKVSGAELLMIAALLAIAAGVLGIWSRGGRPVESGQAEPYAPGAVQDHGLPSIAVLPFADMSPEGDQEFFADGIAEEILNALAKVSGLKVAARTSAFAFKGAEADIRRVGEQLAVNSVLEGSVRKEGNRVRVTAQLIDVQDGFHVWSETYDREMESVFEIQDQIAREVVTALEVELIGGPQGILPKASETNPEAYQAYLRGRHAFNDWTPAGRQTALEQLERAVELDPSFGPAFASLALARFMSGFFDVVPFHDAVQEAKALALRALELDPGLSEAHAVLGYGALYHDWDWASAEAALERALEINPNDAFARHGMADLLTVLGDAEGGVRQVELGRQGDPLSLMANVVVAGHLLFARRFRDVIAQVGYLRELYADQPNVGADFISSAFWELGRFEESLEEFVNVWPDDPGVAPAIEEGLRTAGPQGAMRAVAEHLAGRYQEGSALAFEVARCHARAGDHHAALDWLERGYEARLPESLHAVFYPDFGPLSSDPRFQELLRMMDIPER
jgi:TolB-like protein/tetratricopeptide (TPR) repeat protein